MSAAKTVKKNPRKCPKCGTELGQKNLCPICDKKTPDAAAAPKTAAKAVKAAAPAAAAAPKAAARAVKPAGALDLPEALESFVKKNLLDWNDKFDSYFDSLQKEAKADVDYREAVTQCRRWSSIFTEIQTMIRKKPTLSADLMLEIMDKIPKKFSEIDSMKARSLAREFFQTSQPSGDLLPLLMPESGYLFGFPSLGRKYGSGELLFQYKGETRNSRIAAAFDCKVLLYLDSKRRKVKKGEVIALLERGK